MDFIAKLNQAPMFLIVGAVLTFIMLLCVVYLVKSYRAGIAMGMDKTKLRRAITSSATFTLLPSVSILLGVIALSGSLGIPLPWMRLSVVGALHYEGNVADIAARACGMTGGLGSGQMDGTTFVTIGLVMTAGILSGCLLCVFLLKKYLAKIEKNAQKKEKSSTGKKPFGDVVFSAMFIGLVSAYIGSYLGDFISGPGLFSFRGDWMPLVVAAVSALVMGGLIRLSEKKSMEWVENFSIALSMLLGMAAAVVVGLAV